MSVAEAETECVLIDGPAEFKSLVLSARNGSLNNNGSSFLTSAPPGSISLVVRSVSSLPFLFPALPSLLDVDLSHPSNSTCEYWFRTPLTFEGCVSLQSVKLSPRLKSLPARAFQNCHELRSLVIPNAIKLLPEGIFRDCYALKSVELPSELIEVGEEVSLASEASHVVVAVVVTRAHEPSGSRPTKLLTNWTKLNSTALPPPPLSHSLLS